MKFTEILEELKKGEKVTREEWEKTKTYRYKYIKIEHGDCVAYLKDGSVRHKGEELTPWVGCVFGCADFTAEDWKIYKEKEKNKSWKPQCGEKYYTISTRGTINFDIFVDENNTDAVRLLLGNVFETEEDAKKMLDKLKIINRLRELSNIKFVDDCSKLRYSISYDVDTKKVRPSMNRYSRLLPFDLYFETDKDCQNAIDEIGEENLKKYYFDIVEEDN